LPPLGQGEDGRRAEATGGDAPRHLHIAPARLVVGGGGGGGGAPHLAPAPPLLPGAVPAPQLPATLGVAVGDERRVHTVARAAAIYRVVAVVVGLAAGVHGVYGRAACVAEAAPVAVVEEGGQGGQGARRHTTQHRADLHRQAWEYAQAGAYAFIMVILRERKLFGTFLG